MEAFERKIAPRKNSYVVGVRSKRRKLKETWKYYCHTARIAGLPYLGGYKKHGLISHVIWFIVFSIILIICLVKCSWMWKSYHSRDVTTTIDYVRNSPMIFPSVTFCKKNPLRLDAVCANFGKLDMILVMMTNEPETLMSNLRVFTRLNQCRNKQQDSRSNDEIWDPHDFSVFFDHTELVESCWWQRKAINCSKILVSHLLIDKKYCFTFNPRRDIQKKTLGTDTAWFASGPKYELRLFLNTKENESGIFSANFDGAGFQVFVHDQQFYSVLLRQKPFNVHAGMGYSVGLTTTSSERLGFCGNDFEECFLRCYMDALAPCKCLPWYGNETCNVTMVEVQCGSIVFKKFFHERGYLTQCPHCRKPCNENIYEYHVTESKFPALPSQKRGLNVRSAKHDYLTVDFFFEDMTVETIQESVSVTWVDTLVSVGWTLKISLGVSFTFLVELVFYAGITLCCISQFHDVVNGRRNRNEVCPNISVVALENVEKDKDRQIETREIESPIQLTTDGPDTWTEEVEVLRPATVESVAESDDIDLGNSGHWLKRKITYALR